MVFVAESDPPVFVAAPIAVVPRVAAVTIPVGSVVPAPTVNFVFRMRPRRIPNFAAR